MYTPGSTSPPLERVPKKSTRFSRAVSSKSQNLSQSFILPNIPNTSQIVADHGSLPNVQVHYNLPADEKQIIASLRILQRDLNEAMHTINALTRERDEALLELRLLRAAARKPSTPAKKNRVSTHVEEELFDLSRSMESPNKSPVRRASTKDVATNTKQPAKNTVSDDARVLSSNRMNMAQPPTSEIPPQHKCDANAHSRPQGYKRPTVNDTDNSIIEDPTAASNTSRRRRHLALDENMTSAYILPDITVNQPAKLAKVRVSHEAQDVLHRHEPEHLDHCELCQRLTAKKSKHVARPTQFTAKADFTAQITQLMKDAMLEEPTLRPKISPWHALANVKNLLMCQFEEAKRKHAQAWEKYDAIEAPLNSKKHAAASQDMFHWSKKMEECRINLDQLRDVEEGMKEQSELDH